MKRTALLLALACLSTTGCLEIDDHWVLNPDGSGKLVRRVLVGELPGGKTPANLESTARKEMAKTTGVAAWGPLKVSRTKAGVELTASAYFKQLNAFEPAFPSLLRPRLLTLEGKQVLRLVGGGNLNKVAPIGLLPAAPKTFSAAAARKRWEQPRRTLGIFSMLKTRIRVSTSGLAPKHTLPLNAAGAVELTLNGKPWLAALDKALADEAFLKRNRLQKTTKALPLTELSDPSFNQALFGKPALLESPLDPKAAPRFDYAQELAAVVAAAKLKTKARPGGLRLSQLSIGAVQFFHSKGGQPMAESVPWSGPVVPHASLALIARFSRPLMSLEATLTRATSAEGVDLRFPKDFKNAFEIDLDENERTKAVIRVRTKLLPAGSVGFAELSGVLVGKVGGAPTKVELAFPELKKGAAAKPYKATVTKLAPMYGTLYLEVKLKGIMPQAL